MEKKRYIGILETGEGKEGGGGILGKYSFDLKVKEEE